MRGPAEGSELRMFIETDFYGRSGVLRLRQAFGSYGGLMAGQTWSTFMDDDNFPARLISNRRRRSRKSGRRRRGGRSNRARTSSGRPHVEDNKSTIAARRHTGEGGVCNARIGRAVRLIGAGTFASVVLGQAALQTRR